LMSLSYFGASSSQMRRTRSVSVIRDHPRVGRATYPPWTMSECPFFVPLPTLFFAGERPDGRAVKSRVPSGGGPGVSYRVFLAERPARRTVGGKVQSDESFVDSHLWQARGAQDTATTVKLTTHD